MVISMYRLLLVDSDKTYREEIVNILNGLNYDIAVQAVSTGESAIEFAANGCVDLLITDIKLDDMDGFTLVEEFKTINESLKFIVVSNSSEFADAKRAIKAGAVDYLNKPFQVGEIEEAVATALEQCEESKCYYEQNDMNNEFLKEYVIFNLLYGKKLEEIKIDDKQISDISEYDKYARIVLISFDKEFFNKVDDDFEKKFMEYTESLGGYGHYINLNSAQSVFLLDRDYCVNNSENKIIALCDNLKKYLSVKYARKCFLALSSEFESCNDLYNALEETEELMEGKFYEVESKVFVKVKQEESPIFVQTDDDSLVKQIRQDIKIKNIDSLKADFDILWQRYGSKTNLSQLYIKFVFSNILKEFYSALPNVNEMDLNNEVDKLYRSTGLSTVKEIMDDNIRKLEESFSTNSQMVHREVEGVKQYIYANYKQEIGVEQLAEMVYMAPSYLSCIFKKETGQNLSKFIKSVRMEKAKEMLENTHMKIVNISTEVGYPNVSYFCQSFREYYGISPQKYRANGEN